MKRIAFYLHNPGLGSVDCSSIFESNPGIGGTEHVFLLICSLLSRKRQEYDVTLFSFGPIQGIDCLNIVLVDGIEDAIARAEIEKYDIFVFIHKEEYCSHDLLKCTSSHLSLYPWTHIFFHKNELDYYSLHPNVKKVICVGREQRDLYIDHPCNKKLCYIYNTLNTDSSYSEKNRQHPFDERRHIVTYVGSLVPEKCFHHLAFIWKDIIKEVPDAQLYVIGSGAVYDRTKSLGKYGMAQQDYEDWFMPYLEQDGKLMPSVHFMGRMGKEKEDILFQTKVGVPNPWGLSETFCISAVEMQLCGATVVSGKSPGYYDTFFNGVIVNDRNKIKEVIVSQLLSDTPITDYDSVYHKISSRFGYDTIIEDWERLISDDSCKPSFPEDFANYGYRLKWLKLIIYHFMRLFSCSRNICPIETLLIKIERLFGYRAY